MLQLGEIHKKICQVYDNNLYYFRLLFTFRTMGFSPMPVLNTGQRYLPLPKGPFLVGTSDIATGSNLLMRCFYPTKKVSNSSEDVLKHSDLWPYWLPSPEYADGYLKFKFSSGVTLLSRLFRWLIHNPKCPVIHNASLLEL